MPSTITPTSLRIGPGQLSDSVGSASSLVTSLPSTSAPLGVDSQAVTVLVVADTTLTRLSSRMIVVVDNTAGPVAIDLPDDAEAGDTITFVQATNESSVSNEISIQTLNGNLLHGVSDGVETLTGVFESKSYVNISNDATRLWVSTSEKPVVQSTAASALLSRGQDQIILVDNTGGTRTITLPGDSLIGDRVTVVNPTTATNIITIAAGGADTIDGLASVQIREALGVKTVVRVGSSSWLTLSQSGPTVIVVTTNALTMVPNRETYVLVDSSVFAVSVALPEAAQLGDVVTVVDATGNASTNAIVVTTSTGSDNIMGVAGLNWNINDKFGSITLVRASATVWVVRHKSTPFLLSVSNNTTGLSRRSPDMRVFVDTSSVAWTGSGPQDTIMTPLLPATGDRFTVCDVGGQADVKHITIVGDGTRVIGETPTSGNSQTRIAKRFGSLTLLFTGTRWIEESTSNINPFVLISNTAVLERYGRDFTVQVDTAAGTWSSADTITLPSSATQAMIGDTVTVLDIGGLAGASADSIRVVPSGGTINGAAGFTIFANYGSATFTYVGSNNWAVANTGLGRFNIVAASDTTVTTRLGPSTLVLVDTAAVTWDSADTITLPPTAELQIGDEVRVADSGGSGASLLKVINVLAAAGTINGAASYTINDPYGSATFIYVGTGNWIVTSTTKPSLVLLSINNTATIPTRLGPVVTVEVDTAAGTWSGDTLTLCPDSFSGDMVRVVDIGGSTAAGKEIRILPGGGGTIEGRPDYTLASAFAMATFYRRTGGNWTILSEGRNGSTIESVTGSPVVLSTFALGMNHTVEVVTSSGSWPATGGTVILPATSHRGARITIMDTSGNPSLKEICIDPPGAGTINGSSVNVVFNNRYGSVTLENVAANTWIIVGSTGAYQIDVTGDVTLPGSPYWDVVPLMVHVRTGFVTAELMTVPAPAPQGSRVSFYDVDGIIPGQDVRVSIAGFIRSLNSGSGLPFQTMTIEQFAYLTNSWSIVSRGVLVS